jgi:parvulin-like peptidyl-prolyl isomerase
MSNQMLPRTIAAAAVALWTGFEGGNAELLSFLQGGPPASRPAAPSPAPPDDGRGTFRIVSVKDKAVARVGTEEITIGDILGTVGEFYPEVATDFDSDYGATFLQSEPFDLWVDAYIDLVVLRRDPRVTQLLPAKAALEAGFYQQAKLLAPAHVARLEPNPPTAPPNAMNLAIEQVRRVHGLEVARAVRLNELVPAYKEPADLRRKLVEHPRWMVERVRVHQLVLAVRDAGQRRFERERRERIRTDAERVAERLRKGESFAEVSAQVTGRSESRPKDTLPWISQESPLPVPVLRALFASKVGDIVGPIEIREGFFIGQTEEFGSAPAEDFDKCAARLADIARREEQYDLLAKLKSAVEIVLY